MKIDIMKLVEGQVLSIREIQDHVGHANGTPAYQLALMSLATLIERQTGIICTSEKGTLRLLRDGSERAGYCDSQTDKAARIIIKNSRRLQTTTATGMSEAEARDLESQARRTAILASHAKKNLKERDADRALIVPLIEDEAAE
jgi:hypothetical protein